ncbi:MAG: hypothetical protein QM775_07280 [Pirellulales bacterium]
MNDVAMPAARRTLSSLRRNLATIMAAVVLTLALSSGAAFAQGKNAKEPEGPPPKGYTIQYMFTIVVVLMIVAPMCWPAMRRWDLPFHGQDEE